MSRREYTAEELEAAARHLLNSSALRMDLRKYGAIHPAYGGWVIFRDVGGWRRRFNGLTVDAFPTAMAAAVDLLISHPELWPKEPEPEPEPAHTYRAETTAGLVRAALEQDGRSAFRVSMDAGKSRQCLGNALKRNMQPHTVAEWLYHITGHDYAIAQGAGWAVAMPEAEMRAALGGTG